MRLIWIPLVSMYIAAMLGFRGVELLTVLAFAGTPLASSTYIMAQQMDSDDSLAAAMILITGLGSLLSLFLWVYVLKMLVLI